MQQAAELPENLLSVTSASRTWASVNVIAAEFVCAGRVMYQVPHQEEARLGMIYEEVGTHRSEPRLKRDAACPVDYKPRQINYVPAGMTIWGFSEDARHVKDVRLGFDVAALSERCHLSHTGGLAETPLLRFTDERIVTLMKLLADAVPDPDPSVQLYGDALVTALAVRFLGRTDARGEKAGSKLSPLQLRDALSFLEAHMPQRVELATLAKLAGLSPSHYNRAFKASTGLAPYQWQLQARIERAQALMLDSAGSLEDIAEATGFADAVHFGRTFRRLIGATPSAWRKDRLS
jgi:AraC family transcriptional regulator